MPEASADFAPGPCACSRASTSRTTRRSRASSANWWPRTMSIRSSATPTRPEEPAVERHREQASAGSPACAARHRAASGPSTMTADRRPARARSLHVADPRGAPRPRLRRDARRRLPPWHAKWSRPMARVDGTPGGHRAFQARAWRRSSLIVLERNPTSAPSLRRRAAPDDAEGQAFWRASGQRLPMIDRVEMPSSRERSRCGWPSSTASSIS